MSIDFESCWGIRLATDQPWPGTTLSGELNQHGWPFAVMRGTTDDAGSVTFRIVGGSVNLGNNTAGNPFRCAQIHAYGTRIGWTNVGAYDQNGQGGVGPVDLALEDAFDPEYEGRSDYDGSNAINPSDLAALIGVVLGGGSTSRSSSYCRWPAGASRRDGALTMAGSCSSRRTRGPSSGRGARRAPCA